MKTSHNFLFALILLFLHYPIELFASGLNDEFGSTTLQNSMHLGGDGEKQFGWYVFNSSTTDSIDVSITLSGHLTIDHGPTNTNNWSIYLSGPFVYKTITGDFDVEVYITDNADQNYEGSALMVKQPGSISHNHIQIKHVFANGLINEFQNTINNISSTTSDFHEPYLRIKRERETFYLYTKSQQADEWSLKSTITRNDFGSDLQVGIASQTSNTSNSFVTHVDYFRVTLPNFTPKAIAGTSLDGNNLLQLDGSLSHDIDNDPLSFTWQISGEASPRIGQIVSVFDLIVGDYQVTLTVDDGNGGTAIDTMLFGIPESAGANAPPTTNILLQAVADLKSMVIAFPASSFDAPNNNARENRRKALLNMMDKIHNTIGVEDYQAAIDQLRDIRSKTDGFAPPTSTYDWIIGVDAEFTDQYVYNLITDLLLVCTECS